MAAYVVEITTPGQARLAEFEPPAGSVPEDSIDTVAVASAVSPGTEIGFGFAAADATGFPRKMGYAMISRVVDAGGKSGFKAGELVFSMDHHASHLRMAGAKAWRVPAGVDPASATLARLAGVSWSTLTTTAARPPAQVVVLGLGIIGHLAAQVFAASGYEVLACDPVEGRRRLLAPAGIATCDRLPKEDSAWAERAEMIIDCSGHEAALLDACRFVRKGGEVVMIGVPWKKRTDLSAHELLNTVFHRFVHLRSGWEWEVPIEAELFRRGSIRGNIAAALQWIGTGRLKVSEIFRRADPRDCQAVYTELQAQGSGPLTAVFDWSRLEQQR